MKHYPNIKFFHKWSQVINAGCFGHMTQVSYKHFHPTIIMAYPSQLKLHYSGSQQWCKVH